MDNGSARCFRSHAQSLKSDNLPYLHTCLLERMWGGLAEPSAYARREEPSGVFRATHAFGGRMGKAVWIAGLGCGGGHQCPREKRFGEPMHVGESSVPRPSHLRALPPSIDAH